MSAVVLKELLAGSGAMVSQEYTALLKYNAAFAQSFSTRNSNSAALLSIVCYAHLQVLFKSQQRARVEDFVSRYFDMCT